jgi:hypothetical protein
MLLCRFSPRLAHLTHFIVAIASSSALAQPIEASRALRAPRPKRTFNPGSFGIRSWQTFLIIFAGVAISFLSIALLMLYVQPRCKRLISRHRTPKVRPKSTVLTTKLDAKHGPSVSVDLPSQAWANVNNAFYPQPASPTCSTFSAALVPASRRGSTFSFQPPSVTHKRLTSLSMLTPPGSPCLPPLPPPRPSFVRSGSPRSRSSSTASLLPASAGEVRPSQSTYSSSSFGSSSRWSGSRTTSSAPGGKENPYCAVERVPPSPTLLSPPISPALGRAEFGLAC